MTMEKRVVRKALSASGIAFVKKWAIDVQVGYPVGCAIPNVSPAAMSSPVLAPETASDGDDNRKSANEAIKIAQNKYIFRF